MQMGRSIADMRRMVWRASRLRSIRLPFSPMASSLFPEWKKILHPDPTSSDSDFHVVVERLTSSGKLDRTFGSGGKFSLPAHSNSTDSKIALHGGKILVYGSTNFFQDGFIVRLNSDGRLDKTFNREGQVTLPESGAVHSLSVNGNEKITALAGSVIRLTSAGAFDSSFSHDGISAPQSVFAQNMFVNADGSVLIVGTALNGITVGGVVIERYTRRGDIDRSYGNSGLLVIAGQDKQPGKVIEASGGKRYVIGSAVPGSPDTGHIFIARLGQSGGFDKTFGVNGFVMLANAFDDAPLDAALAPHGTLVIAAEASSQPHLSGNSGEFFRILL